MFLSFQERHQVWVTLSGHSSSYETQTFGLIFSLLYHPLEAVFLLPAKGMVCSWLNFTTNSLVMEPCKPSAFNRDSNMQQLFQRQFFRDNYLKMRYLRVTRLHFPLLSSEDCVHVIPSAVALTKCQRKSARLYLLPISREDRKFVFLSQQYKYQTSQKASGKLGIPGEFQGMQASAGVLQMGRQKKSLAEHHRGIQQIVCSTNNCSLTSVGGIQQILQYLSLYLPSLLRKADLMRTMSESNTGDQASLAWDRGS